MRVAVVGMLLLLVPLAQAATAEVQVLNGAFSPPFLQARAGEPVLFTNVDDRPHTVTSVWDGGKSVDVLLRGGQAVRVTFAKPGTYDLRCTPHSTVDGHGAHGMAMSVQVSGGADVASGGTVVRAALGLTVFGGLSLLAFISRAAPARPRRRGPRRARA